MGDIPYRELYDEIWPIFLEGPEPSRREVIEAKQRAAELVEKIRLTIRRVVLERTLFGISDDLSADELRRGMLNSIVFSPQHALMLARKGLKNESSRDRVY
jgi:hypothetical protein